MEGFFDKVVAICSDLGLKLLAALLILFIGFRISAAVIKWFSKSKAYKKMDPTVASFLKSAIKTVLLALVFVTAAMTLGVPATSFVTILASCGLAIGLAMQGALSNFAGGFMLLIFKPFLVGDYIEADGRSGVVKKITVFYTFITTYDNIQITIPNGVLANQNIVNYSRYNELRVDGKCSVSYEDDIDKVKAIILDTVKARKETLKAPEPVVFLENMNDSSLDFTVKFWINVKDYGEYKPVLWAFNEDIVKAFKANGITIPYPQLDVHTDVKGK